MSQLLSIAILGASGYTGAELVRLLSAHPHANIVALSGDSQAGKAYGEVYPHLAHQPLPALTRIDEIDFSGVDLVFCCLPHATTQNVLAGLPDSLTVIDLSADFRLRDREAYQSWYGKPHEAPELQKDAVYGLCEHNRAQIIQARLIANPGCYPTSMLLPLLPLAKAKAIWLDHITIASMSGVSGAGRAAKQATLFSEVNEGAGAYGVGGHRHVAEVEQEIGAVSDQMPTISFTPHLVPMSRGISSSIHVAYHEGQSASSLHEILERTYVDEPFVTILPLGHTPTTHQVRGTNRCIIGVAEDRIEKRAILVSVIDNMIKGASGQAVQNMNIRYGFDETLALPQIATVP